MKYTANFTSHGILMSSDRKKPFMNDFFWSNRWCSLFIKGHKVCHKANEGYHLVESKSTANGAWSIILSITTHTFFECMLRQVMYQLLLLDLSKPCLRTACLKYNLLWSSLLLKTQVWHKFTSKDNSLITKFFVKRLCLFFLKEWGSHYLQDFGISYAQLFSFSTQ